MQGTRGPREVLPLQGVSLGSAVRIVKSLSLYMLSQPGLRLPENVTQGIQFFLVFVNIVYMSADSKSLGAFSKLKWEDWVKHNDTHAVKSTVGEFNLPCLTHMLHWSPSCLGCPSMTLMKLWRIQVVTTTRPRGWAHFNLTSLITIFPRWSYCGFWDTFSLC